MNTKRITTIIATLACLIFHAETLSAQVPEIVNYDNHLSGVDANFTGTGQFEFALVDSTGTITYWSNDGSSTGGSQPTKSVSLPVVGGYYTVGLGNQTLAHMTAVPFSVFSNSAVYLKTWFNDGTNGFVLLTPNPRIGASGYAMVANTVIAGAIGSSQLESGLTLHSNIHFTGEISLPATTSSTVGVLNIGGEPFVSDFGGTNTFVGPSAGNFALTGAYDTATGQLAAPALTSGYGDTTLGAYSLYTNTAGSYDIALGFEAGYYTTGDNDIDIGNLGVTGESDTIRIGTDELQTYLVGNVYLNSGLNVDENNLNTGTLADALTFGTSSGEGIASDRSPTGVSPYDLEFWTDFGNRLEIQQHGNVGIGTATPSQKLEVNGGYVLVDGLSGVQVYIGDDGSGNDVQIGSFKSGITNVACYNETDAKYMRLVCSSIQINGGSDLAEPFAITHKKQRVAEGNVVVIDDKNPGHLTLTDRPYDTRVAGVVSGANGVNPGIQMRQDGLLDGDQNVALTGRVYVQADTSNGPIEPGDMLTTSDTPGVAMKVTDHVRAQGAILGKAMSSLQDGHGMVLVLVTLQ